MVDARNLQQDIEAAAKSEQDWLMCYHPDKYNIMSVTYPETKPNTVHI